MLEKISKTISILNRFHRSGSRGFEYLLIRLDIIRDSLLTGKFSAEMAIDEIRKLSNFMNGELEERFDCLRELREFCAEKSLKNI
jgi:hypothetical protein